MKPTLRATIVLFFSSLSACSERSDAAVPGRRIEDSSAGTVALGIESRTPYRPGTTANGSIQGTIVLQAAPGDSMVAVGKDSSVCGDSAGIRDTSGGGAMANSLVWVDDIPTGKALPEVRRETLTIDKCRFEPRLMAVVAKTTINVFSRDRVMHSPKFYREGADHPIDVMRTVDAGQVVPSEKIAAQPGIVEVRCAEHPFARAWIAVFDHPYFAITDDRGSFTIDGLPAGTYNVKVWHEGMAQPSVQRVVVGEGGASRLETTLAVK